MATDNTQKCVGVTIFDDFSEDGLTALKWASDRIKLPNKEYELCVILIRIKQGAPPREIPPPRNAEGGSHHPPSSLNSLQMIKDAFFGKTSKNRNEEIQRFDKYAGRFAKNILGKMYEGQSIKETLEFAIKELQAGLDTIIVRSQTILSTELKLPAGCSIVPVVKTDGAAENTVKIWPTTPQDGGQ